MNGMDEWQAIQNEKMRLMKTVEDGIVEKNAEIDQLKMSRAEWRSRAECAEERIYGWVKRVEGLEKDRDAALAQVAKSDASLVHAMKAWHNTQTQLSIAMGALTKILRMSGVSAQAKTIARTAMEDQVTP
jgi:chromosome segregation ATPase